MQKSTGKELAIIRVELAEMLERAIEHHNHCGAARGAVANAQQVALFHAWQTGIWLNKMKPLLGHGAWLDWLDVHFCKPLEVSYETAALYMRIDIENPHVRDRKPNLQRVKNLKFDTIRKYQLGFAPDKEQPKHKGNVKLERSVTFLNIVNEYERIKTRYEDGLQQVDFDEAREETKGTKGLYQFLRWLHGDSLGNPWSEPGK